MVDSLIEISYFKNNYKFEGSTNYLLKDLYDKLNFKISKLENQYNFNFDINFDKNKILIEELNYLKKINSKSNLKLVGKYIKNKQLTFQNIKFVEEKNNLQIVNLFLNKKF